MRTILVMVLLLASNSLFASSSEERLNLDNKMKQTCADKSEGDLCDFENDKGETINGQCKRSGESSDSELRCMATN